MNRSQRPQPDKRLLQKTSANILNGEGPNIFSQDWEQGKNIHSQHSYSTS